MSPDAFALLADRLDPPPPSEPEFPAPGALAKAVAPSTVQTPALDLIDSEIIRAFTTRDARLIVSMPPQEGKSERVTKTGVLWALIQNRDLRVGIVSYSQELAEGFGRSIREWITSNNGDDGSLDLGLRIARDNGAARRWRLSGHRGGVISVGIGAGLTGRPLDVLIIDDPFADAEDADSELYRNKVWNWWLAVGSTRLAPGAPVIVILTRWHEDDLAGRLQAAEDGHLWRVVNIPAFADHKPEMGQTDPLGREPGQWLTSARGRTPEEWEAIRVRAGTRVFNALYQGRPSPESGDVWHRDWWQRYHLPQWAVAEDGVHTAENFEQVSMSWDMAFKDTKSSDYVVGQVWGKRGPDVYLLDQVRRRMSFTASVKAVEDLCERWPQATAKWVEDKANGTAVLDQLRAHIGGLVPVSPTESKYARAAAVAPFIEAGNVYLPDDEIALFDVDGFIDEAAAFPNGTHDDQVDGCSQALNKMLLARKVKGPRMKFNRPTAA